MSELEIVQSKFREDMTIEELNTKLLELKHELSVVYDQEEFIEKRIEEVEECLRKRISELDTSIGFDVGVQYKIKRTDSFESKSKPNKINFRIILGYSFVFLCSAITLAALLMGG